MPTTPAPASTWITLDGTVRGNNGRVAFTTNPDSEGNPIFHIYNLSTGAATTVSPSAMGEQGVIHSSSSETNINGLLSTPDITHPDGLLVLWINATIPQEGLTPASPISAINAYDPASGRLVSSVTAAIPADPVATSGSNMRPGFATSTLISGVLDEPNDGTDNDTAIAFSLTTGQPLWRSSNASGEIGTGGGALDQTGTILLLTGSGCSNVEGIDGITGQLLFTDPSSLFGPDTCVESSDDVQPFNATSVIITDDESVGGWIINARTGALDTPPPGEDATYFFDGRGPLVAVQSVNGDDPDGSVTVYDSSDNWAPVYAIPQAQVGALGLRVTGMADGDLYATTSTQQLVASATTGATITTWKVTPVASAAGWVIGRGPNPEVGSANQYLLISTKTLASQEANAPVNQ
jgi:hypothetical protein